MSQLKVYEFNQVKSLVTELVRLYKTKIKKDTRHLKTR